MLCQLHVLFAMMTLNSCWLLWLSFASNNCCSFSVSQLWEASGSTPDVRTTICTGILVRSLNNTMHDDLHALLSAWFVLHDHVHVHDRFTCMGVVYCWSPVFKWYEIWPTVICVQYVRVHKLQIYGGILQTGILSTSRPCMDQVVHRRNALLEMMKETTAFLMAFSSGWPRKDYLKPGPSQKQCN